MREVWESTRLHAEDSKRRSDDCDEHQDVCDLWEGLKDGVDLPLDSREHMEGSQRAEGPEGAQRRVAGEGRQEEG